MLQPNQMKVRQVISWQKL